MMWAWESVALDVLDAPLDKALLLAGGVILGVFFQIAVGARLGDGLDDARTLDPLEPLQLLAQFLGAPGGQRDFGHDWIPLVDSPPAQLVFPGGGRLRPVADLEKPCERPRALADLGAGMGSPSAEFQ